MINRKRVALMTRLALEEKKENRKQFITGRFWALDYFGFELFKSIFAVTVAYAAVWGVWLVAASDTWTYTYHLADVVSLVKKALVGYGISVVICFLLALVSHVTRYRSAFRKQERMQRYLRELDRLYREEKELEDLRTPGQSAGQE